MQGPVQVQHNHPDSLEGHAGQHYTLLKCNGMLRLLNIYTLMDKRTGDIFLNGIERVNWCFLVEGHNRTGIGIALLPCLSPL